MKLLAGFLGLSAGSIVMPSEFEFPEDGKYDKKNTFCFKHSGEFSGINHVKSFPEVSNDIKLAEKWLSARGAGNPRSSMSVMFNKDFRPEESLLLHACEEGPDVRGLFYDDELVGARFGLNDCNEFYVLTPFKGVLPYKITDELNFNGKDAKKFKKQRKNFERIVGRDVEINKQDGHSDECHKVQKWVKGKVVDLEERDYPFPQNEVSLWDSDIQSTLDNIAMMNQLDVPMRVGKEMYEQVFALQAMHKGLWDFSMQMAAYEMGVKVPCFDLQNCLSDPERDCLDLIGQCGEQKKFEGLIKKFMEEEMGYFGFGNVNHGDIAILFDQIDEKDDMEYFRVFVKKFVKLFEKKNPEWDLSWDDKKELERLAGMLLMQVDEFMKGDKKPDIGGEMSIEAVVTELFTDPTGFLEDLAEMDMEQMMAMVRSLLGPMMDEEMIMVVEEVMQSMDWEMVSGALNGLSALLEGKISIEDVLDDLWMMNDLSGFVPMTEEILNMVGLPEQMRPLIDGFLEVSKMILSDIEGFLEAVNEEPDMVAMKMKEAFGIWFSMLEISDEDATALILESPLFSFDTDLFNAIMVSNNTDDYYGAIAMVTENLFETIGYISEKLADVDAGMPIDAEMLGAIKGHVDNVSFGILYMFLNFEDEMTITFGIVEVIVQEVNNILETYFMFKPTDVASMLLYFRDEIQQGYDMVRGFILPRVADAIDVAMSGRDTIAGLLHVGVDQVNHLGNMTGFFIDFDEIDMMFTDAPAIASWMDAVRYGLMGDPQTDEYFSYLLEDGSSSSSSSSSSVV
ncbi:Oidioi.mRNA.OKI2018_I69.chr1.g525.t1.cds [Oikopleura dioica]|uniref:Oidioi.mRNA.OKI2018_I69.chr1.g525.t1.cds n=1 Tax=Oikopleura dioica TaxID=34765 RepID=A0ABN7SUD6_OIKDI|nr:Oidioi.mRNA.OKI2018_I69.chr1.g525.t1.cds [Oikopleura dioica]